MEQTFSLAAALVFAIVHLFAGRLRFLEKIPRSRWLSAAGGVAVAYVFLHLLPEVGRGGEALQAHLPFVEERAYLVALVGLATFYGLEQEARKARSAGKGGADGTPARMFWIHTASFALYNLIIGYLLLHREESGLGSLLWYAVAMALHFVVNDVGLREHHKERYRARGRWILAGAVLAGWGLGAVVAVPGALVTALFAFLAGGVVLNVLKEELPEERKSRYWAFVLGAGGYAALLVFA